MLYFSIFLIFVLVVTGCYNEGYVLLSTRSPCYLHSFCKWYNFKCYASSTHFFWGDFNVWGVVLYPPLNDFHMIDMYANFVGLMNISICSSIACTFFSGMLCFWCCKYYTDIALVLEFLYRFPWLLLYLRIQGPFCVCMSTALLNI